MSRIIAHRGAHRTHGENTCEAFEAAVQEGAKWLETDVRLLADGALVLFHDDDLRRIYKRKEKISDLNEEQAEGFGIMSLRALLDKRLPIGLNLELKLDKDPTTAQCRALGKAVGKTVGIFLANATAADLPPIFISSFHLEALTAFREMQASLPCGLACRQVSDEVIAQASARGAVSIHSSQSATSPADIQRVLDAGLESYVYTINDPAVAAPLWQAGMTGLFTDRLDLFAGQL